MAYAESPSSGKTTTRHMALGRLPRERQRALGVEDRLGRPTCGTAAAMRAKPWV